MIPQKVNQLDPSHHDKRAKQTLKNKIIIMIIIIIIINFIVLIKIISFLLV